jgi:hypothetical protein
MLVAESREAEMQHMMTNVLAREILASHQIIEAIQEEPPDNIQTTPAVISH